MLILDVCLEVRFIFFKYQNFAALDLQNNFLINIFVIVVCVCVFFFELCNKRNGLSILC